MGYKFRSRAPLRISFAGGGTDIKPYFEKYGGAVISATIGVYAYSSLELRDDKLVIIKEPAFNIDYSINLENGNVKGEKSPFFDAIIKHFKPEQGFYLISHLDTEYGSGLGSSSAMMVSLVGVFKKWLNINLNEYEIAELAYKIEREDLGIAGGMQDQYASTFGGFNFIEFKKDDVIVNRMKIKNDVINELQFRLLLVNLYTPRFSGIIHKQMQKTMQSSEVLEHYEEIKKLAVEIKNRIYKGSFEDFGELLKEEWEHKKQLSEGITNPQIDAFFEKCEKNGALGYKLLGAGGGGYALLFTDEEHRHELIKSLAGYELRNVEFVKNGLEVWGLDESKRIH